MTLSCISPTTLKSDIVEKCKSPLTFSHMNMQSLRQKYDDFCILINEFGFSFSVIMLTETWYSDLDTIHLDGYSAVSLNRKLKRGGGVCMFTKLGFTYDLLDDFSWSTTDIEIICIKCNNFVFAVVYRPPDGNLSEFFTFLEAIFSFVNINQYSLILGGDLNIDMLTKTPKQGELSAILDSHFLFNVITTPTRITATSETLIDLFITNLAINDLFSGTINVTLSDHLPIYLVTDTYNTAKEFTVNIIYQDINAVTLSQFRDELARTSWNAVFACSTADTAYDHFIEIFSSVYKKHFPYKEITKPKRARKPWVTLSILKMIRTKNRLYQVFLKNRDLNALKAFRAYRNSLSKTLRQAKRDYYHTIFNGIVDVKQMWKKLNTIISSSNRTPGVDEITIDNHIFKGTALANKFNGYFTSLSESTYDGNALSYMPTPIAPSIFIDPTEQTEVNNVFMKLKKSKSEDIDGIKMEPVIFVIDLLSPCLTHIYNIVLSTGMFPKRMKNAKVAVLYKGGDKNEMSNYRPISVLPIFSKALEKIIFTRLYKFLDSHSVITTAQYGFRSGVSTETALLHQKELILGNIEARKLTLGVFIDFTKAFDRIDHQTLLEKLFYYGIRGIALDLIESYLSDRYQCVSINRQTSMPKKIKRGVPQGSILGPLLFNLYINDIVNVDHSITYIIYADDTSLFFTGTNIDDLIKAANKTLVNFSKWSCQNSLQINSSKTKAVLFRAKGITCTYTQKLMLNNFNIELSETVKTLGVIFHQHMFWNSHTEQLCIKLRKALGVLRRCQSFLPLPQKLLIFNTLFCSHLRYCQLVWASGTETSKQKLYTLQKSALRAVANIGYREHTSHLFVKFKVLKFCVAYEHNLLLSLRSEIRKNCANLRGLAHLQPKILLRPMRSSEHWHIPRPRTNYGLQMLKHSVPHILNKFKLTEQQLRLLSSSDILNLFV